jgi:type IV secretion system protein VirD4
MKDKFNNTVGPQVQASKLKTSRVIPSLAVVMMVAGLQSATQYFACEFGYQLVLGANFKHIYAPWAIVYWAEKWSALYQHAFMRAASVGVTVTAVGLLGLVVTKMVQANSSKVNPYLHGSARWASKQDIQKAGLLPSSRNLWQVITGKNAAPNNGVYVGAWLDKYGKQHYLRHNGPEHILCYAPTRSGKGVGLVVPTLLSWPHSSVITDLKGELWALTAGWRQ